MIHADPRRMTMGAPVLDDLIGGGLHQGTVALVDAPPAMGGRLFTEQLIRANMPSRDCIVISTELPIATYRERVINGRADQLDQKLVLIDATGLADDHLSWARETEEDDDLRDLNGKIRGALETLGDGDGVLVVIDSVSTMLLQSGTHSTYMFLRRLIDHVRRKGGCVLLLLDSAMHVTVDHAAVRHLADLVVQFDQGREHQRILIHGADVPRGCTAVDYALSPGSLEVTSGQAGGTIL